LPRVQDLAKEVPPIMNVLNIHENLLECLLEMGNYADVQASVPDPDPHVFGPPGSGSTSQRYGSGSGYGSGSFYHHAKIVRKTLILTIL
jgi:hypothetical protein